MKVAGRFTGSDLLERSRRVLVGGVNSPVRAMRAIGRDPIFVARAEGPYVWDTEGRRYVDYLASWGPAILGHAPAAVTAAIQRALPLGTSFGAPTQGEVLLAEAVTAAFPSIEQLRMTSSGSEAVTGAIRLARAATGREVVVKAEGGYHGAIDGLLAQAGSGATTLGVPTSPGVPEGATRATRLVPYNDLAAAEAALADAAAMIVEPVAGNMGVVPPAPGYLEGLREACDRAGALLILDEVITGFRLAYGGAQERYGVRADITCLGKVLGAGLPVGAFGGPRAIMGELAPEGPCYQAGTLSGNPLATAAGLAMLGELSAPGVYSRLEEMGEVLEAALLSRGAPAVVNRVGSMLTPFFADGPVTDYASATRSDTDAYGRFARDLLDAGIYPPPSQFEAWFVSLAHGEPELAATRRALHRSASRSDRLSRPVRPSAGIPHLESSPARMTEALTTRPPAVLAPLASPPLTPEQAEGLDLILEGFLLHHGRPRSPGGAGDGDKRVLAGDYCYAQGLVRVAAAGDLFVINALADLIALSAGLVAQDRREALHPLWRATVAAIAGEGDGQLALALADGKQALRRSGETAPLERIAARLEPVPALAEALSP